MLAALDDFAALDHQDRVGVHDGVQAMGDDDGGAAPAEMLDRLLNGFSDSELSAAVASSSRMIGAFLISARATAMRWRWPPDSCVPCSPTGVS